MRTGSASLLFVLLTTGCEAQTTVVTSIVFPSTIASKDRAPTRLHVAVARAASFSQRLDLPDGKCPEMDPARESKDLQVAPSESGFKVTQSAIPSVPEFCAAAWFDSNDDGKIDSGDGVAAFSQPYPSQPSTFFGSNRYESPALELRLLP